jgi:plasmid stability protein
MAELIIPDLDEGTLTRLQERAAAHGRTLEAEVKQILTEATHHQPPGADAWAEVDAIRARLAASGQTFRDSAELLREDRER